MAEVQPLLGLGHHGPTGREVPSRVFYDLSTWHLIQWLYTAKALREAEALRTDYSDRRLHARLMRVLQEQAGHRLADAVEQGKITASSTAATVAPAEWARTSGWRGPRLRSLRMVRGVEA